MEDSDLASFGLLTADGRYLTNAGALLADEPLMRHSRIFCTRWTGNFKDNPVDDAEFTGNLLVLLREAEAFIKRLISCRGKRSRLIGLSIAAIVSVP